VRAAQLRAWNALDLGPAWQARDPGAGDAAEAGAVGGTDAEQPPGVVDTGEPPPVGDRVASLDWPALRAAVADCRACGLSRTRTQTVFGVGDERARWMLVGEAPGAEEDARGEPFVGQAGRLLDNMLATISLARGRDVFIANVLKCRPPGNRNPEPEEVACCEPFLRRQVELVAPRVVLVMGRFAAQSLLRTDASIASLRGRVHRYAAGEREVPVVVTYHPAYLLRNLGDKAKAWADLCLARRVLQDAIAEDGPSRGPETRTDGP